MSNELQIELWIESELFSKWLRIKGGISTSWIWEKVSVIQKISAKTSNFCSIFGQSFFGGFFKGWNFWAFLSQVKPIYKIGMIKNYSSGANENVLNQILSSIACLI